MNFCPYCKKSIQSQWSYCHHCNKPLIVNFKQNLTKESSNYSVNKSIHFSFESNLLDSELKTTHSLLDFNTIEKNNFKTQL
ncbi:MAG: hypothetical protein ACFFAO_21700, partial [Candidatus Hermodarchaeota archaeon]